MNFEYFISKKLIKTKGYKSKVSSPIIKIAVTAISIGIIMMILAFGTGLGLQQKIRDKITAFNGHITIRSFTSNQSNQNLQPIDARQDFYPKFESVPEITHVQKTASKYGVIRTENDFEGIVVKGVSTDYDWSFFDEFIVEGRKLNLTENISKEIMISEYLADRLGFELGDKVIVYFLKDKDNDRPRLVAFDIVGIYNSGFLEFDKQFLMTDIKQIQRLNKWEDYQIGQFELMVSDFDDIQQTGIQVYENIGSFLNATTIVSQYPTIFEWIALFDVNIALIVIIMVIIAGINMITALLVLILEQTQLVGILKALGCQNFSIRKIFLYNATYLILKGLFWGNLIGIGLLLLQKNGKIISLNPETYYVTHAPVYIDWTYLLGINLGTILVCLLMLLLPSYIITKISPVKAIKFD
ncbi:ABC transporter permease [Flavobacterium sp. CS20]|uniref:ABC transporter permease n=1 Tax=Flavobacterium sp. CS20 TaxID=2775246 RepID=UPI001B3A08B6|nr:ABC transporter permease [Flavobacterium sp. CS20]QTY26990.1 ABC transporter permease [Flavobacterium sp. CS20]